MKPEIEAIIQQNRRDAAQYIYIHYFSFMVFTKKYRTFPHIWAAKILDIEDGYLVIKFETERSFKVDLECNIILTENDFEVLPEIAKEQVIQQYDPRKFSVGMYVLSKTPKIEEWKFNHQISNAIKAATTEIRKQQKQK